MLRIVDMEDATSTPYTFAIWNTVTDSFLKDSNCDQCWDSLDDIEIDDTELIERISLLVGSFHAYRAATDNT